MEYKFFRISTKEWEKVDLVDWVWEAKYKEGKADLKQYGDDGIFHQIAEIDQRKLKVFVMRSIRTGHVTLMMFPKGAKLVHLYQNHILEYGSPDQRNIRIFVFGYELPDSKVIMAIMPDGSLVHTNNIEDLKLISFDKNTNV